MYLSSRASSRTNASICQPLQVRALGILLIVSIVLALISVVSAFAETSCSENAGDFLRKLKGEWVGTCEQSTDGEKAEDKYFHVVISEVDENTFEGRFSYYRLDPGTQLPVPAGSSTVVATVQADGSATSAISGKGTVMVYEKLKSQEHNLTEVITAGTDGLQGEGTGTISVGGMPFGLGRNGKVTSARSLWSLQNGVFSVKQTLKVGFKALFIHKSFDIVASYTAKRGSDVASLIREEPQVSPTLRAAVP